MFRFKTKNGSAATGKPRSLDKLILDPQFLDKVKQAALAHCDDAVPYGRPDLYQTMMFVKGLMDVLKSRGYKMVKGDDGPTT